MIRLCHSFRLLLPLLLGSSAARASSTLNSQIATSLLTTLMMLAVVITCFLGLAWLTRRLQAGNLQTSKSLKMVESLPVGRHEKICIVRIGNQYQVLGITAQQITLLDTLERLETESADSKSQAWNWAQQFLHSNKTQ